MPPDLGKVINVRPDEQQLPYSANGNVSIWSYTKFQGSDWLRGFRVLLSHIQESCYMRRLINWHQRLSQNLMGLHGAGFITFSALWKGSGIFRYAPCRHDYRAHGQKSLPPSRTVRRWQSGTRPFKILRRCLASARVNITGTLAGEFRGRVKSPGLLQQEVILNRHWLNAGHCYRLELWYWKIVLWSTHLHVFSGKTCID